MGDSRHDRGRSGSRFAVNAIRSRLRALVAAPSSPHETRGSSVLRPTVFRATDGLVANVSLIMGIAGASSHDAHAIVLAVIAGLLAGSFSMAVGEYVSVRSQHVLLDYQVELQRDQLRDTPTQERAILVEIYAAKGLSRAEANLIVDRILANPEQALDTFVLEELSLIHI